MTAEQACRYTTEDCDLTKSFSDPPGDSNGAGPGVKLEWEETVSGGHRLTIQERNHENAYDVMDAGKPITVVYRGDDFTAIVAADTVAPEHADERPTWHGQRADLPCPDSRTLRCVAVQPPV